jgi:hypothetical protein
MALPREVAKEVCGEARRPARVHEEAEQACACQMPLHKRQHLGIEKSADVWKNFRTPQSHGQPRPVSGLLGPHHSVRLECGLDANSRPLRVWPFTRGGRYGILFGRQTSGAKR